MCEATLAPWHSHRRRSLDASFQGKVLKPPPGIPDDFGQDNCIRFEDPLTRSDVSVWWRPLFSDSEHKEQKGLLIDGVFRRPSFKW